MARQNPQGRGGQAPPPPPRVPDKWKWPEKPVLIGTAVKRLDGPDKVTGRANYTYDINRPGMIYGKIVRSPLRARARRVHRPDRGAEGAGREDRARVEGAGRAR